MDRRNGGTSLAPPRPPKSLPRVHRPRAPEPHATTVTVVAPAPHPTPMIGSMSGAGATTGTGSGHLQRSALPAASTGAPPQLSPKPRHLIGGSVSNGNDSSSSVACNNISSNGNNNASNNSSNNNNTIFMNNNPHNHTSAVAAAAAGPTGDSSFNSASLINSSSRSNSSTSSTSNSTSSSASSRCNNSNLNHNNNNNNNNNNNSSSSSSGGSGSTGGNNARSGSSQPHQHHQPHPHHPHPHPHPHHHQHNHPHQQSNRSIGSNSSTLSSVSSSSSTVALLRPHQIAPLVPLHTRSATPPPPPLPPHQRPTSPAGSTFARRRHTPSAGSPPAHHHPHLASIPHGSASDTGGAPPVLLLPVDQPIGPAATTNASNPTTPVTLAAPRPEAERLANEYVDTPFGRTSGPTVGGGPNIPSAGGLLSGLQPGTVPHQQHRNLSLLVGGDAAVPVITGQPRPAADRTRSPPGIGNSDAIRVVKSTEGRHGLTAPTGTVGGGPLGSANSIARGSTIITKQPAKKKDGTDRHELLELELQHHHHHHHRHHGRAAIATVGGVSPGALGTAGVNGADGLIGIGSITCPRCRRCRCEECQKPRPLPSHWLCDKSCLCSAETIIDYASCLCCVKALYYHCSKEHEFEREVVGPDGTIETETVSCADDPCSCVPHKRTTRWGCLGALSVALPCLWCYWPMRGCVAICARCYAKHSRHGCRCTQHPAAPGGASNSAPGGILNGSMFGTELLGGPGGGVGALNAAGLHELRAKGDPADGDATLQHLHHQLRHHLHHRSADASSNDLTTPEKRLLDTSTDTSY
ncbi:protein sprouty [Anopheles marshallii]|uniref:protein sprouty n=1 Tax=Anopheles marshallii TaxID=1521116 RepID=UPI00237AD3C6|nr:protein sprouty [Anopheles marshallii]